MRNVLAIVERELRAYFSSPVAYVVLTIFVFLAGIFFQGILSQVMEYAMMQAMQGAGRGAAALDMPGIISRQFLQTLEVIFLFMIPMITMALFSEEKRRGTMELLLTSPITDLQVVLGKFLAAVSFFLIIIVTTWIPMSVLYIYGKPASGPIFTAYLGLLLYGLSLVAIGMFISTLTESQIIAGIISFGTMMGLWMVDFMVRGATGPTKDVVSYLGILTHLDDFMKGVLATSHVIFYLSLMFFALFLTYRSIDSLRWRG